MSKMNLKEQLEAYALKQNFAINREYIDRIVTGLEKRQERYGLPICPCRMVTNDPEENKRRSCPCAYHLKEIAAQGHCHCNLFLSGK